MRFYIFDLEVYRNCFLFGGKFEDDNKVQVFEISSRKNQLQELLSFLNYLKNTGAHMVGYNSLGYDYPILHTLLTAPYTFNCDVAYMQSQQIIGHSYGQNPNHIRMSDRLLPQIDLVKINHFDNPTRRTSLKSLQFAMRSASVEDLPFPYDSLLESWQMDKLISYNVHDLTETELFLKKCKHLIKMRQELIENGILSGDVLNHSDVKIGTEYLVKKIGRSKCFISGSTPRQSARTEVNLGQVILPKVSYRTEQFNAVLNWFKQQTVYIKSDDRPRLETSLGNLQFHFGVGGVHASVENKVFVSNETHVIKDIDVGGMYPAVAIVNGFAPEHLGQDFTNAYRQLSEDRKQYPKGSAMNLVLKLANNGAFGNSNNVWSCFYDPKFTFSITINGQLQLLQLVELLSLIPGVELIQANTDGITAYVPKEVEHFFNLWCNEWEAVTGLKLEHAQYKKMWIRDVNNYLALGMDGKIKRKGAYWYPIKDEDYHGSSGTNWNKDFSNLSAQIGVEGCLIHDLEPRNIVRLMGNPFDFMLRYKTTGTSKVYLGEQEMPKTVRYYVSTSGQKMWKLDKPKGPMGGWKRRNKVTDSEYLRIMREIPEGAWDERIHTKNKSKYEERTTSIESGRLIKECNVANKFDWSDVDWDYYTKEIEKLRIGS